MEFRICERGTAACNIGVDTHLAMSQPNPSGKVRNLYAQLCKCVRILGSSRVRPTPLPPFATLWNCTAAARDSPRHIPRTTRFRVILTNRALRANKYTRLNKYSAAPTSRILAGSLNAAVQKGLDEVDCSLPISAFLPPNFATVHCSFVPAKTAAD